MDRELFSDQVSTCVVNEVSMLVMFIIMEMRNTKMFIYLCFL